MDIKKVILKMTSRKFLTLNNIFHVYDIVKNLVLDLLLSKHGLKMVFDKICTHKE
jgi:hypothetical protein